MAESDHRAIGGIFSCRWVWRIGNLCKAGDAAADAEASAAILLAPRPDPRRRILIIRSARRGRFRGDLGHLMCPADERSPGRRRLRTRRLHRPPACGALRQGRRPLSAWSVLAGKPQLGLQLPLTPGAILQGWAWLRSMPRACVSAARPSINCGRPTPKRRLEGLASGRLTDERLPLASWFKELGLSAVRRSLLRRSDLWRQSGRGLLEVGGLSGPAGHLCARYGALSRQALSGAVVSQVDRRFFAEARRHD